MASLTHERWFGFDSDDAVLITGAASGIGRATALLAGSQGLSVGVLDRDEPAAVATVNEITNAGGIAELIVCDVTDKVGVTAVFQKTNLQLRYLVNNAGPATTEPKSFEEAIVSCIGSVQHITETWMAALAGDAKAVVNISSVAGNVYGGAPDWYSSSKAALAGYSRFLATKFDGKPRANAVSPGTIDTPRTANSERFKNSLDRVPSKRAGAASEVAAAIVFLLSPLASYINGQNLIVDGGRSTAL